MTCNVTGTAISPNGQIKPGAKITFRRAQLDVVSQEGSFVIPDDYIIQTASNGTVNFNIMPGVYDATTIAVGGHTVAFRVSVPDEPAADFADLLSASYAEIPPASVTQAQQARDAAIAARDAAEAAADAAAASVVADYFVATDAQRLALSPLDGETVYVSQTGHTWKWQSGAWVDMGVPPFALATVVPSIEVAPSLVPLVTTDGNQVSVWLKDGYLDARGMARGLRNAAVQDINSPSQQGAAVPIIKAGKGIDSPVIAWLDAAGRFRATGLRDDYLTPEAMAVALASYQPRVQPSGAAVPVATDGRSLWAVRRKIARIAAGDTSARLRIAYTGDSWSELVNIPNALIDLLSDRIAPAAGSFIQANDQYLWPGVTLTASSGWTRQDASINSDWPYGTGPDGQVYHATAAGETITVAGIVGASLRIYSRKWGGSWTYSLNGGSPVSVTEAASDGSLTVTEITGLTAGGNTLVITKSGTDGRVAFCGIRNVRTEQIEVMKIGNSGLTGYRWRDYAPLVGDIWADIAPDLVITHLGTNDYRNDITPPSTYLDGIVAAEAMIMQSAPGAGIIHVMPPETDGTAIYPLSSYRDTLYQHCLSAGSEMLNLFDSFGPHSSDVFADALHLNPFGATAEINALNHNFLGV